MEPLLTVDEVAALLNCRRMTVRRAWMNGALPKPIRINRRAIRWRRPELELWIEKREGSEVFSHE